MLVDLSGDRIPHSQRLIWLQDLFQSGLRLILYVDPFYDEILKESTRIEVPDHVTVVPFVPQLSVTYQRVQEAEWHTPLKLPEQRNTEKDTVGFCRLMHLKPELVARAVACGHVQTPFVGFLDASISKILKTPGETWEDLRGLQIQDEIQQVILPGCWLPGAVRKEDVWGRILWTFCGGAFWLPTWAADEWWRRSREGLEESLAEGRITWEVNTWAWIWKRAPEKFQWFPADHNDRMLRLPAAVRKGWGQN
jgi:hypothetical protein